MLFLAVQACNADLTENVSRKQKRETANVYQTKNKDFLSGGVSNCPPRGVLCPRFADIKATSFFDIPPLPREF